MKLMNSIHILASSQFCQKLLRITGERNETSTRRYMKLLLNTAGYLLDKRRTRLRCEKAEHVVLGAQIASKYPNWIEGNSASVA
ncbi:unnamed protein product [Caenorhabditis sp. 36 PRJEB53466]|nr:unnamed protein product [Caenorhabditis sp. 36 PRJEB53466]